MADIESIYGSDYLSAQVVINQGLLNRQLTIKAVRTEVFRNEQTKLVLNLDGTEKELVVNKTNAKIIAMKHGNDYNQWVGKQIQLQVVPKNFQGQIVNGIQVFCP